MTGCRAGWSARGELAAATNDIREGERQTIVLRPPPGDSGGGTEPPSSRDSDPHLAGEFRDFSYDFWKLPEMAWV